jgi:hypothetical protein
MRVIGALLALLVISAAHEPTASPRYFQKVREIKIGSAEKQSYFPIDPGIWAHARPDLADLRIYSGDAQVPYAIAAEESSVAAEQRVAPILNLGAIGSETHFDLDMQGLAEYDHVQLRLTATNFVANASIDGRDTLGEGSSTHLGSSTIYDFSRERLGSSFVLRMPASTFRYLHVRISGGVEPHQVVGAEISFLRESKAIWTSAGSCSGLEQREGETMLTCNLLPGAPLARLGFEVPAESFNFRRTVTVSDDRGVPLVRSSISRIRMDKARPPVVADELTMAVPCGACQLGQTNLRVIVDNGDDPPLASLRIEPQALGRRVYFDPQGRSDFRLYYGDEKLAAPVYDYAKFFKPAEDAAPAQLGAETPNPIYTPRPDERPWSERHPAVLWTVMIVAVAVLAGFAIRGLVGTSPAKAR